MADTIRPMIDSREGFDAETTAEYNAYFDATEQPMYDDDYDFDDFEELEDEDFEYDYDDSMDGDFDSAMRDAGWGTDEDYGYYGDCDYGDY